MVRYSEEMRRSIVKKAVPAIWLLVLVGAVIMPSLAGAHAYLERSEPVMESQWDEAPAEIRLKFSEPIDPRWSRVTVVDERGTEIPGELQSEGDAWLIYIPESLEDGIYKVYWQVLSVDTHVTDGSFRFSVAVDLPPLRPQDTISLDEFMDGREQPSNARFPLKTYGRIVDVLLIIAVAGWFFVRTFILYEAKMSIVKERILYGFVAIVVWISGWIQIFAHFLQLGNDAGYRLFFTILFMSNAGIAQGVQMITSIILCLLTFFTPSRIVTAIRTSLFLLLFFTFAWSGHAAQGGSLMLSHVIHMAAISIWFGGLIGLTVHSFKMEIRADSLTYFQQKVTLFSRYALGFIVLVILSGLFLSVSYVKGWELFFQSSYGQTLLFKLVIFLPILLLGALHRYVWLPQLRKGDESKARRLAWGMRIELLLAIALIVIAGLLSTTSPPQVLSLSIDQALQSKAVAIG